MTLAATSSASVIPALAARAGAPARLRLWTLALVALAALAVYANSLANGFAFDDYGVIQDNPTVRDLEWTRVWTSGYWPPKGTVPGDVLYRPLTICSYLLNQAVAPDATWAFHATNVALHALCSVLVTLLAWRLFRRNLVALAAGVLFAIHPLHTEAVANVVGRAEILAAIWSLLALLIFLPENPGREPLAATRPWYHGGLVALCLFLALLCKETPATLLAAFPLIDLWRWSHAAERPALARWLRQRTVRYYLPLLVFFGIYLAARIHAVGLLAPHWLIHPLVNPLMDATPLERLVTPFMLLAKYIVLFVFPKTLASDYSAPSLMPTGNPLQPLALLGELLVLGAVVVCASWYRRRPGLVLTILLFGLSYALIANFLRIGTIFGERLFYWPSVFACLGIGALVAWLWAQVNRQSWRRVRPAAVVLALALAGLLSWRTVIRNPDWKSNQALALATALDNAQSAKALEWAGQVLVCSDRKDWYPTGEQLLLDAIKLHPNFASAYWELAKHYFRQERTSEGVIYLAQSAVQDRSSVQVRQAILATRDMLRDKQPAALQAQVEQWNRQHPDNPAGYLALSWTQRAQGHRTEAIASVRQSLTLDPTFQEAGAELGLLYLEAGDAPSAVRALRTYASYACNSPEAQCQLAFALLKLNPLEYPDALAEAEACMNKAEALDPVGHSTKLRQLRAEWLHLKTTLHAASRSEAGARSPA